MYKQSSLLLIVLITLIFSPSLINWILSTDGAWYRPFVIWLAVIFVTFIVQRLAVKDRDA